VDEFEAEKTLLDTYKSEPKVSRWCSNNKALAQQILLEINSYHLSFGIHWFPSKACFASTHDKDASEFSLIEVGQLYSIHRYQLEDKGLKMPASIRNQLIERCLIEMVRAMRHRRKELNLREGRLVVL
jgi:hypothetical protein